MYGELHMEIQSHTMPAHTRASYGRNMRETHVMSDCDELW